MLGKVKELLRVKEDIDKVAESCDANTKAVYELTSEIKGLKHSAEEAVKVQRELVKDFQQNMGELQALKKDLEKEVYDFKLFKGELQGKILQKLETGIKDEVAAGMKQMEHDASAYNELRLKVNTLLSSVANLSVQIDKFTEISRGIKKEDFELTKYANKIFQEDQEKLRLLKKIDSMERLVASMRRRG